MWQLLMAINQSNENPSTVDLVSPDSVMVLTLTPEMYWTPARDMDPNDIISYEMHWWRDGIEYDSVLTDTNAVILPRELADNSLYFWNVIAMDQNGGISHSDEAFFWTDLAPEPPLDFVLSSPENNSSGLSQTPSFVWEATSDPDPLDFVLYTIQIAIDSNMVDLVFEQSGLTHPGISLQTMDQLDNNRDYWWRVIATDTDLLTSTSRLFKFTVGAVSVADNQVLPTEFVLDQNYPNPFNPSTTLSYGLPEATRVSLSIYDIRGNIIRRIDVGIQTAGWHEQVWNGTNNSGETASAGLYFARLQAGHYSMVIKILMIR